MEYTFKLPVGVHKDYGALWDVKDADGAVDICTTTKQSAYLVRASLNNAPHMADALRHLLPELDAAIETLDQIDHERRLRETEVVLNVKNSLTALEAMREMCQRALVGYETDMQQVKGIVLST